MRPLHDLMDRVRGAAVGPPVRLGDRAGGPLGVSLLRRSKFGGPDGRQLQAYGSVGTLFAIVSMLAEATSKAEWKLYRTSATGQDADRVEVTRHQALEVWNRPNPFYTRQEFIETVQQHVDLTGEGWWLVGRNELATFPMQLWPVRPDRMSPVPDPKSFLSGYVYHSPDGEKVPLGIEDVVQLRMPNPEDPYRGLGPVQSLLTDLDSARLSAEYNRNFFLNSAEPGGIIEVDRRLSDPEFDEMVERWREQHQGVSRAHRVAILEQGRWVDRKYSMRDMQFTELREVSREVIREAFHFPKSMLGAVDDVNRANAESGEVAFARWLIVPRLERIKQALNVNFLPMFGTAGQGLEFDYIDPTPADRELEIKELSARAEAARELVTAGFAPDDVLSAVGLPEMRFQPPVATREAEPDEDAVTQDGEVDR
jgi:HK97 family phage portal protein